MRRKRERLDRKDKTILRWNRRTGTTSRSGCGSSSSSSCEVMGAVYAGWLTKSPEDRKGLFSLFAALQQWKRRFFVLYSAPISSSDEEEKKKSSSSSSRTSKQTMKMKNSSSSSSSPVLVYYEDETMTSKKGFIDLDDCDEIVDHVESCYYQHLFLLKTVSHSHRGRQRTYYLAADTPDDVTSWVKKLRSTMNLCEDELFRHTVLSITKSGSDVTGIIATVSNSDANNSETSETNAKKSSVSESLTSSVNPERQLSHIRWLIVNSEQPNNIGIRDSGPKSRISVSKCGGKKVPNQKVDPPFETNVISAEATSTGTVPVDVNSAAAASNPSSIVTHHQSNDDRLQNEELPSNGCNGHQQHQQQQQQQQQTGAEYCDDWPKFVKELLDDGDEHQETEKVEEEQKGGRQVEGKSVFYVCNMSSFSTDTTASPNDAQNGQQPTSSESNAEEMSSSFPSNHQSSDVTCYLRITKGSHRYKSVKRKQQNNIATLF